MEGGGLGGRRNGKQGALISHTRLPGVQAERNHSLSVKGRPGQQRGAGRLCSEVADSVQSGVRVPPTGPGKVGGPSRGPPWGDSHSGCVLTSCRADARVQHQVRAQLAEGSGVAARQHLYLSV